MKLLDWTLENNPKWLTLDWKYLRDELNVKLLKKYHGNILWVLSSEGNSNVFEIDTEQMKIVLTRRAKNIDF